MDYTTSTIIQVEMRSVYGVPKIYPANQAAATLARIAGTKTLSERNLADAKSLGMVIQQVQASSLTLSAEVQS